LPWSVCLEGSEQVDENVTLRLCCCQPGVCTGWTCSSSPFSSVSRLTMWTSDSTCFWQSSSVNGQFGMQGTMERQALTFADSRSRTHAHVETYITGRFGPGSCECRGPKEADLLLTARSQPQVPRSPAQDHAGSALRATAVRAAR
jgi:hypothetical protein